MNYSVTQGTNYATIAGAIVILAKLFGWEWPADEVTLVVAALAVLIMPIWNAFNRYMKGGVKLSGFKKY